MRDGRFVIIGLGNPGPKYAETRHNAGFWFLDALAASTDASFRSRSKLHADLASTSLCGVDCILAKPSTFMNESGRAAGAVVKYFRTPPNRMLVAYDELDLPPGTARLKQGGGHGGHNGLRDVFRHVSDHEFMRLRIGIGHPGYRDAVTPYVLSRASAEQEELIRDSIAKSVGVMAAVVQGDLAGAMKALHTEKEL